MEDSTVKQSPRKKGPKSVAIRIVSGDVAIVGTLSIPGVGNPEVIKHLLSQGKVEVLNGGSA